jgi:tetratricopeptide (TPR) repeat protein
MPTPRLQAPPYVLMVLLLGLLAIPGFNIAALAQWGATGYPAAPTAGYNNGYAPQGQPPAGYYGQPMPPQAGGYYVPQQAQSPQGQPSAGYYGQPVPQAGGGYYGQPMPPAQPYYGAPPAGNDGVSGWGQQGYGQPQRPPAGYYGQPPQGYNPQQPAYNPPNNGQPPSYGNPANTPPVLNDDAASAYSDQYITTMEQATEALQQGRLTDGIKLLEKAKQEAPDDSMPTVLNNLATAHIKRGNVFHNKQKLYAAATNDFRRAVYYLDLGWPLGLPKQSIHSSNLTIAKDNLAISYEANKIAPNDKAQHLTLGKTLRAEGKFEEAAVEFAHVLKLDPAHTEANKALGQVFTVLNMPDKAKTYLAKGGPLDDQTLSQLANAQNQSGEYQQSVETLNKALAINPNNQSALNQLKTIWQNEIRMNPNNMVAHANLGSVLQKLKQYPDAEKEYLTAENLAQQDTVTPLAVKMQLRLNIGTLFAETNRVDKALEAYNAVLQADPRNTTALYYKATLYKQQNQLDDALTLYTQLLQLDPNNTNARKDAMAALDKTSGDASLQRFADGLPQDATVQAAVGEVFHRRKQHDQARMYYGRSLAVNPNQAAVHANLGAVYQALDNTPQAEAAFAKAMALDPNNTTYKQLSTQAGNAQQAEQYQRALQMQQADKFADSLPLMATLVTQAPSNADYQASYGVALQQTGKLPEAITAYEKAIKLAPSNAMFHYSLGTARHQQKQYTPAKVAYQRALTLDPTLTDAKDALAMLEKSYASQSLADATKAYQAKEYTKASQLIQTAIRQDPQNATAYYYQGLIQQAQKQNDAAITSYRKASQVDPTFVDAYYAMAILLDAKKDTAAAKQAYQSYVQKSGNTSDSATLQYAKQRLQKL